MNKLFAFISLTVAFNSLGQKVLQDFIELDTILYIEASVYNDKMSFAGDGDELWVYKPALREDTLDFEVISLSSYDRRMISCTFPSMYFKIRSPQPYSFSVSENLLCLFVYRTLILIRRNGYSLTLLSVTPINESFDFMKIKGDYVYFGKNYNSHPKDLPIKTILGKYNLKTETLEKCIFPKFDYIEFSHFERNRWVDFAEDVNVFSQSTKYSLNIYDDDLELIESINYEKKNWFEIDTAVWQQILSKQSSAKSLIQLMHPIEDTMRRIELVYLIDSKTILLEYTMYDELHAQRIRKVDIWTKSKEGKFELKEEDIVDLFEIHEKKITKKNYHIALYNNENLFFRNKLCQWNFGTTIYPIGLTYEQIRPLRDDYLINNDNVYVLKFYNCKTF